MAIKRWINHKNPPGRKQKAIQEMAAIVSSKEEYISEAIRNHKPVNLLKVPGLSYSVHHVAGFKYVSLIHDKSDKFLIKNVHVKKVKPVVDLANHFFKGSKFDDDAENLDFHSISAAAKSFTQEIDRLHLKLTDDEEQELKRKELKAKQKSKSKK